MGIFPTDVPIDTSGLNADLWHFKLSEPFNGHHVGALLEDGRTLEPVMGRILRRIAGGMGSALIGAVRVSGGGDPLELGDCSWFHPPAPVESDEQKSARLMAEKAAAEEAAFEAELAAEAQSSTPAAASGEAGEPSSGAAVPSSKLKVQGKTK